MTGKELFNKHLEAGKKAGPGTKEWEYAHVLMTAFYLDPERLYELLEEAEKTGKRVDLEYPIDPSNGPSEPTMAILV